MTNQPTEPTNTQQQDDEQPELPEVPDEQQHSDDDASVDVDSDHQRDDTTNVVLGDVNVNADEPADG